VARLTSKTTQVGEAFVGAGVDAADINTVLGERDGPVGTAWATSLAIPRPGHIAFVCVLRPNLPVKPFTLFVNKAPLAGTAHERLTWGAARAGVASGVLWAVADDVIGPDTVDADLLIAAVWVDPGAGDEEMVYDNNRRATREALEAGRRQRPDIAELLAVRDEPWNPFFRTAT
jgi:5,6,7,8-tetrahydromethanopterin hydro-lyase